MAPQRYGTTWWGRAWIDALEHSGTGYESRLPRGRTYARKGAVRELELGPGHVAARVVGSHGELYRVDLAVKQLADSEWHDVAAAIATKAAHLAALLDGELDPGVVADAESVEVQLLPRPADLRPDCECPDWAEPCKHAAAVCYVVAQEMDRDPFALFLLRGMPRHDLIDLVRQHRAEPGAAAVPAPSSPVELPGVDPVELWAGRSPDEPLAALPPAVAPRAPRQPGRHVPWSAEPPARFGIDPTRVDELAEDAVQRAWHMLVDDQPSGLRSGARADLARRAAQQPAALGELAALAGLTPAALRLWAEAWWLGGDTAVEVVADPQCWSTDQQALAAGRDALEQLGHTRRSIALNYDSLLMSSVVWLVIGPDHRWYRLQGAGKHQDLRLSAAPADDLRDLVDPPHG